MGWISPTSVYEESGYPWDVWDTFTGSDLTSSACDDDTGTYIRAESQDGWTEEYLEAKYTGGLWCSKVRVYLQAQAASQINLDAYYDDAWHDVYGGSTTEGSWKTYRLPKIAYVTKIRLKLYTSGTYSHTVNEIDFWEIEEDVPGDDNLVALYKCNENADNQDVFDASGNGHNGTASVNTSVLNTAGKINDAFDMDDQYYVNYGDIGNWNTCSLSFWLFPISFADTANIMRKWRTGNCEFQIIFSNIGGHWRLDYVYGETDGTFGGHSYSDYALTSGEWQHIVVVRDGSNINWYRNGTSFGSDSGLPSTVYDGSAPFEFKSFDGKMDAVMIFDKELTENEVAWLNNKMNGRENEWWDYVLQGQIAAAPKITCEIEGNPIITSKVATAAKITSQIGRKQV